MVRGRGCNESFRAAIDKSNDGPADEDDDDLSDQSWGLETLASGSSRQGVGEATKESKDKKKKAKDKTKEKQHKGKGKEKITEAVDESDEKTKMKGFGLLRTMTQHTSRLYKGFSTKESDGVLHQMTWLPQSPDVKQMEMVLG
ncbi:partitioning defective 3 homolog B-like [Salvelinus fontinalis]|uniref:partitioning defective 3 homolog B-like n=1 Tax=Salvelinus fontinalis TaxID=8038 RepID=UPI00248501CF|nr:partitioning defective 3 homolog B-like [Salvelinus fontinalis]